jgi:hypothetical protein
MPTVIDDEHIQQPQRIHANEHRWLVAQVPVLE